MNKLILILISGLFSLQAYSQIQFENPTSPGIAIEITSSSDCRYDHSDCLMFDKSGTKRIKVDRKYGYYSLYTSDKILAVDNRKIPKSLALSMTRQFAYASKGCPVKVIIDPQQLLIADVRPSCPIPAIETVTLTAVNNSYSSFSHLQEASGSPLSFAFIKYKKEYEIMTNTVFGVSIPLDSVSYQKLEEYISKVSPTCPLTIQYSTKTSAIIKASLGCDPKARNFH